MDKMLGFFCLCIWPNILDGLEMISGQTNWSCLEINCRSTFLLQMPLASDDGAGHPGEVVDRTVLLEESLLLQGITLESNAQSITALLLLISRHRGKKCKFLNQEPVTIPRTRTSRLRLC